MGRHGASAVLLFAVCCMTIEGLSLTENNLRATGNMEARQQEHQVRQLPTMPPGVPDISGDLGAARNVLDNVNGVWENVQSLYNQTNETVGGLVDSALEKLDEFSGPMLDKVQSLVDAMSSMPFAPGDTGAIQDLVNTFIGQIKEMTEIMRLKLDEALEKLMDLLQGIMDKLQDTVNLVMGKCGAALDKIQGLRAQLAEAAGVQDTTGGSDTASEGTTEDDSVEEGEVADLVRHGLAKPGAKETDEWIWPFGKVFGGSESVWDKARSQIDVANSTFVLLVDKVDGINESFVEAMASTIMAASEEAVSTFTDGCSTAVYSLPDLISSAAADICAQGGSLTSIFTDGLGPIENTIISQVDAMKAKLGFVSSMIASLYELVDMAEQACAILKDKASDAKDAASEAAGAAAAGANAAQEG